jgi:hypothetical protein
MHAAQARLAAVQDSNEVHCRVAAEQPARKLPLVVHVSLLQLDLGQRHQAAAVRDVARGHAHASLGMARGHPCAQGTADEAGAPQDQDTLHDRVLRFVDGAARSLLYGIRTRAGGSSAARARAMDTAARFRLAEPLSRGLVHSTDSDMANNCNRCAGVGGAQSAGSRR